MQRLKGPALRCRFTARGIRKTLSSDRQLQGTAPDTVWSHSAVPVLLLRDRVKRRRGRSSKDPIVNLVVDEPSRPSRSDQGDTNEICPEELAGHPRRDELHNRHGRSQVLRTKDGDRNSQTNATERMGLGEPPRRPELSTISYECSNQEHYQCAIWSQHLRRAHRY
jgi:hypothetical protein